MNLLNSIKDTVSAKRERKLRIVKDLCINEGWKFIENEYRKMLESKENEIRQVLMDGDSHRTFLLEGFKMGVKWCMNLPLNIIKEQNRFLEDFFNRLTGGKNNGS